MSEWVDMDVVRHALGYGIAAMITALCAWVVTWIRSRTPEALVDKWWEYVQPRVDSAMKRAQGAMADGTWGTTTAKQIVGEELSALLREFMRYEARQMPARELEAARQEIEEAMERAVGGE